MDQALILDQRLIKQVSKPIVSIGIDVCSVTRILSLVDSYDDEVLSYLFTNIELDWIHQDKNAAVIFAAKEAVGKALGTGLSNMAWTDIECCDISDPTQIKIQLYAKAKKIAEEQGVLFWQLKCIEAESLMIVGAIAYG